MPIVLAAALAAAALAIQDTAIPDSGPTAERIDADRPHVGTGAHVIPPGEVQFEVGVQWQRSSRVRTFGSPTLVRIGVADRMEVRIGSDGFLTRDEAGATVQGVGNAQFGAKFRLAGPRDEPILSVMPTINLGLASRDKALGSGETDATFTVLAGHAIGSRLHVEGNYGIGSIGDPDGRFQQHLLTGAIVHQTTGALSSYVETAWWSRQERGGDAVSFVDYGAILAVSPRVLIDGGAFTGVTSSTPDYGFFVGVSFALGPPGTARPSRRRGRF
jgi:hypothetical protein